MIIFKTEKNFTVCAKTKYKKLQITYSFDYFEEKEAESIANKFLLHLKKMAIFGWDEIEACFKEEKKKRDLLYVERGKGIVQSSGKKCYSVYFRYVNGRSPNFRIQFSKMQFGDERALALAKRFYKDFCELENNILSTDDDVNKLIGKYEKIKMKQELINLASERRNKIQEFRIKKNDRNSLRN